MNSPFRLRAAWPPAVAGLLALLVACALQRVAPDPVADVARGSEEAFARGLEPRELPPRRGPQRWLGREAVFRFRNLPVAAGRLEVALHGQRAPVAVVVDGVIRALLLPGTTGAELAVVSKRAHALDVRLRSEGFVTADGRRLGALLDRVALRPVTAPWPTGSLALGFVGVAACLAWAGRRCGLSGAASVGVALGMGLVQALCLYPFGLLRSPYAASLALLLAGTCLAAGLLGGLAARRWPGAGPWSLAVALLAALVLGVAASSPVMIVSDAVFHANKLAAVAGGDLFPTSVTQHARPFRIPYGVSFYALLAPLLRLGLDGVTLVRCGAAAAGALSCVLLYRLLLPRDVAWAGASALLLLLLPGSFDVYSYGNLSNAFGQALGVAFFCWWASGGRGILSGTALVAAGATAHLSSLIVLVALALALAAWDRGEAPGGRRRLAAALLGLALAGLYYLHFLGLVLEQLPRLLEGGGQGNGPASGAWGVLRLQLLGAVSQWGLPALVLAWAGRPRRGGPALDRALLAFWSAGAGLAAVAVLTPLDVRYLYALTLPLAVAAGAGLVRWWRAGGAWRLAACGLLGAQLVLAARGILEAVLERYRA